MLTACGWNICLPFQRITCPILIYGCPWSLNSFRVTAKIPSSNSVQTNAALTMVKRSSLYINTWQSQFNNNHVVEFWLLFFVGLWSIYSSLQHLLFSCERNETFWIINFLKLRATERPRIETLIQSNKRVFAISIFDNFQFNFCCFMTDSIKVVALSQSLSFPLSLSIGLE